MQVSVYIATSLDGFIARSDDGLDWLPPAAADGEDYGYQAFIDTVDVIVMGRRTFEKALTFDPWPYSDRRVVVLSARHSHAPGHLAGTVQMWSGEPAEIVDRLSRGGAKHVYLDGGKTIQRFLGAGFVHRLIVTRVPVLVGGGIPLFGPLHRDIVLRHVATRQFPSGLVQSEYVVAPLQA